MKDNKSLTRKDIEVFMIAQFMDLINSFEKYETIDEVRKDVKARKKKYFNHIKKCQEPMECVILNLYDKNIDAKLKRCQNVYADCAEYKMSIEKLQMVMNTLNGKLDNIGKEELEEITI